VNVSDRKDKDFLKQDHATNRGEKGPFLMGKFLKKKTRENGKGAVARRAGGEGDLTSNPSRLAGELSKGVVDEGDFQGEGCFQLSKRDSRGQKSDSSTRAGEVDVKAFVKLVGKEGYYKNRRLLMRKTRKNPFLAGAQLSIIKPLGGGKKTGSSGVACPGC